MPQQGGLIFYKDYFDDEIKFISYIYVLYQYFS